MHLRSREPYIWKLIPIPKYKYPSIYLPDDSLYFISTDYRGYIDYRLSSIMCAWYLSTLTASIIMHYAFASPPHTVITNFFCHFSCRYLSKREVKQHCNAIAITRNLPHVYWNVRLATMRKRLSHFLYDRWVFHHSTTKSLVHPLYEVVLGDDGHNSKSNRTWT